jgi:uncharacterized protein YukE
VGSLSVDPDALHAMAGRLNAAGDQVAGLGLDRSVDTGSPVLTAALDAFGKGWQEAARASSFDLRELGSMVGAAATVYRHTDLKTAKSFVVPEK